MPFHPCADGLTPSCFKAYPAWARQALAYKLLHMLLPKQLTKNLPRLLGQALVAPGVDVPPGLILPPGTVVPPDTSFPPGWTPDDPPPEGVIIPPPVSPVPPDSGPLPPIYTPPFEPGPVHPPAPGPGVKEYTVAFDCSNAENLAAFGDTWGTIQGQAAANLVTVVSSSPFASIMAHDAVAWKDLQRLLLKFNLLALPPAAEMVSGYVLINTATGLGKTVCLQTAGVPAWNNVADYSKGTGAAIDPRTISGVAETFTLTADALSYCKDQAGGYAYFMAREYNHDFLNFSPAGGQNYEAQFYNQLDATPALRPTLTLVYKA